MFKKTTALLLSLLFAFSAFGAATIFSGVISAGAVYYDYYDYIGLPGWSQFTAQDLTEIYNPGLSLSQTAAPSYAPERVTNVTKIDVINSKPGEYEGHIQIGSFVQLNIGEINPDNNPINVQWCAKKAPSSGATLAGGRDFSDDTGICFWVAHNGEGDYIGNVKINIFCLPCAGPTGYYTGDDPEVKEAMNGFCFEATKSPDADGYVYFDFKTDFSQVDWYWRHDDGKNYTILNPINGKRPMPYNALPYIDAMTVSFSTASAGDVYYIGDFCAYRDSRIHTDELSEAIDAFDSLDSEAYTEESYAEATEVYLRAYEMLLDDEIQTKYTQREVDDMAQELFNAIASLMPMFPARADVQLNGFGVWTDEDLETISDGGISLDPLVFAEEGVGPADPTIEVIANGDSTFSEPYYGWSCFKSTIEEDGDEVAVKNPFGADLSETAGIRFWIKNPEEVAPTAMQIIVGTAGEAEFVVEDFAITRPLEAGESGYVYASWSSFYEFTDTGAEIFDYLDKLDYIGIQFEDLRQVFYYISDLHAYNWSLQNADTSELIRTLAETRSYVAGLNEADYTPRSWAKLMTALDNAEALLDRYGVTQDEVDAARDEINSRLSRLFPIGTGATLEELNYLYSLTSCAKNYWRGNYTGTSYNTLKAIIDTAEEAIDDNITSEYCRQLSANIENAIAGLIPITHAGSIEKGFFSFEDYSGRDLSKASGDRTPNVRYTLAKRADVSILPTGYDQALMMESLVDMSSGEDDEHGVLQFKSMYRNGAGSPIFIEPLSGDPLVRDLSGSDGFLVWVGVNDVNLVSDGTFRVGVSCCDISPLFEMHAIDIPLPPTGSGWIYIPWNYFDHYDEWTHGEPIRLNNIRFYIFRFDGEIKQGLQVYITGLQAYTGTAQTSHVQPVFSNLTDGQTIDVSGGAFIPQWNIGNAMLDGKFFTYGSGISSNGKHTIKLINGDKQTELTFNVTGGEVVYEQPYIYGVTNGGEYAEPVTITWNAGEATLNGEAIGQSTVVSEPGSYTVRVVNEDKEATVTFTITGSQPPVKKGDFNGNGKIEVDDALAALRIAARLAEATPEAIAIGDIDGNGAIEVNDALSILRVAAKLADESSLG